MQPSLIRFSFCAGVAILAQQLSAHHSFSAEFDAKQLTTYEGVVTKVEWTNPHVYFYADVKGKEGQVENWAFQTAGPKSADKVGLEPQLAKGW
jgi:hypothetical protein